MCARARVCVSVYVCVCVYEYVCVCVRGGCEDVFVWRMAGGIDTAVDAHSSGTPGLTTEDSAQQPAGWKNPSIR